MSEVQNFELADQEQIQHLKICNKNAKYPYDEMAWCVRLNQYDNLINYIANNSIIISENRKKQLLSIISGREYTKTGQDFSKIKDYLNNLDL